MSQCITRFSIDNQKTKICYLILNPISKTKKAVFFIISILDSDKKIRNGKTGCWTELGFNV